MTDYTYSASGAKLSVMYTNGATTTNNQYCGNMLYEQIREPSPDLPPDLPKELKNGANLPFTINVSGQNGMPGDIQTAKGYPRTTFRVFNLQNNRIQYYNGNGIY